MKRRHSLYIECLIVRTSAVGIEGCTIAILVPHDPFVVAHSGLWRGNASVTEVGIEISSGRETVVIGRIVALLCTRTVL